MENKPRIYFLNQSQFGYHIDYLYYCKYLKRKYDITYICWDYNMHRIKEEGITVIYLSREGNKIVRNLRFFFHVIHILNKSNASIIFIHYFRGASLIKLIRRNKHKHHLDIRTGGTSENFISRSFYNLLIKLESLFFDSKSIISEGLRTQIGISKKTNILPLGAVKQSHSLNREYVHLLYVGSFDRRKLEETIKGIRLFLNGNQNTKIHYTIVGSGWKNEENILNNEIAKLELENYIELKGYVPYNQLSKYYEAANVGISYIPLTSYFQNQPVTKTYEYLMAGMPVIATETYENKKIINKDNGILIKDTPESFAQAVTTIKEEFMNYDEHKIRLSVKDFHWKNIVNNLDQSILNKLISS